MESVWRTLQKMDDIPLEKCSCKTHLEYQRRVEELEKAEAREDIFDAFVIVLILVYPLVYPFLRRIPLWIWNNHLKPFYQR